MHLLCNRQCHMRVARIVTGLSILFVAAICPALMPLQVFAENTPASHPYYLDPLYSQLATCMGGAELEFELARERAGGMTLDAQKQLLPDELLKSALFRTFLDQLYAADENTIPDMLQKRNGSCIYNMVGISRKKAETCYERELRPFYSVLHGPHPETVNLQESHSKYLACMKDPSLDE